MGQRRLGVIVALVIGVAFGVAGLLLRADFASSGKTSPRVHPLAYTHRSKAGAGIVTTPQAALDSVLAHYGGKFVVSGSAERRPGSHPGTVLNFELSTQGAGKDASRAQWETDIVAGAVADKLAGTLDKVVSTTIGASDGSHPELVGGMGDIVPDQNFSSASDTEIRASVLEELAKAHLTLISLDILRASQPAPAVVALTSDPPGAAKAANDTIRSMFGQDPPKYEGYFFDVRDRSGNSIFTQSAAFRTGAGRLSFSKSVADVISLNHG